MPELPRAGREYLWVTLANVPLDAVVEVSFDEGVTWNPTTLSGERWRILVAGPDFPDPPNAVRIDETCVVLSRITDNPEVILRHHEIVWIRPAAV